MASFPFNATKHAEAALVSRQITQKVKAQIELVRIRLQKLSENINRRANLYQDNLNRADRLLKALQNHNQQRAAQKLVTEEHSISQVVADIKQSTEEIHEEKAVNQILPIDDVGSPDLQYYDSFSAGCKDEPLLNVTFTIDDKFTAKVEQCARSEGIESVIRLNQSSSLYNNQDAESKIEQESDMSKENAKEIETKENIQEIVPQVPQEVPPKFYALKQEENRENREGSEKLQDMPPFPVDMISSERIKKTELDFAPVVIELSDSDDVSF